MNKTLQAKLMLCLFCVSCLFHSRTAFAKFVVTGSNADKTTWNNMVTTCSAASASFQGLITKINGDATKTVTIKLVRNKKNVLVDSWVSNEVDLSDLEDLAKADPKGVFDRCQALAHFLKERWYKAEHPGLRLRLLTQPE